MKCLCPKSLKIGGGKYCACLVTTLERTAPTASLDSEKVKE